MMSILDTAALNTVQDLGRTGYRHLGVGSSGAMDPLALQTGNILLGNAPGVAAIELQTYPFVIRFDMTTSVVVTGIDATLTLDDVAVLPWFVVQATAGQVLTISPPRRGARAYLCVSGGIDVPDVLGSRSTQLRGGFGGLDGRFLQKGDTLTTISATAHTDCFGAVPPEVALPPVADTPQAGVVDVRAIPATDYTRFSETAQERFWATQWRITPQSDRVGYRLSGDALALSENIELRSYGIVPGIVQVPPAGQPIVQMADANTAGGYPRIACVIEADLWRLAQARIGSRLRFHRCDHLSGVRAMQPVDTYLADLQRMAGFYRASQARRNRGRS